jgi:Domain of unknown function DUF29
MAKVLERSLYQTDYYAWTKQQAAELRRLAAARADSTLDLANLAEEVESLGISQLSSVKSQMRRVMEHLLKLEHSSGAEPRGDGGGPLSKPAMRSRTISLRRFAVTSRPLWRSCTSRAGGGPEWLLPRTASARLRKRCR